MTRTLVFTLTMPGNNSWNGRWSGEGRCYVISKKFTSQKAWDKVKSIVGYHSYNFGDGWRAAIDVSEMDGVSARKIMKTSQGFCGYDWMVNSLLLHGKILNENQVKALQQQLTTA